MTENIRLVIWDLDETFWHGTLTEGGVKFSPDAEHTVKVLARRGIISSICSKNDPAEVDTVLTRRGIRDFFVFPSISWEPKGPRLARLIEAVQLRPETVLFIDDNAMNRAEAAHFVPGLQIADETIVPGLRRDPRLQGKADPDMTRLAQYKILERRHADEQEAGADTVSFLRASGITVRIEPDLDAHIDRAIELINRTNQLNFTKKRLPEDPKKARAELRALLAKHTIQAGLLHVRDKYGDYGFCGLYVLWRQRDVGRKLLHFTFSCRILGMVVATWLYRQLDNPVLDVKGDVLTDVKNDPRVVDWITAELPGAGAVSPAQGRKFAYVLARGGCDMRALAHYFGMVAGTVHEEFDTVRAGQTPMTNHSVLAMQAIDGMPEAAIEAFAPLGFVPEDFATILASRPMPPGPALWLLSFSIELYVPLYKHKQTGALLPAIPNGLSGDPAAMLRGEPCGEVDPAIIAHLREQFEFAGEVPDDLFRAALRRIFGQARPDVRVFVLLGNERTVDGRGREGVNDAMRARNAVIAEAARDFPQVSLLSPLSFMSDEDIAALKTPHHFGRMVYFRMFQHIMAALEAPAAEAA